MGEAVVHPAEFSAAAEEGRRVTWVELFFDLVFVFAVTRCAELLEADHGWLGVLRALVVFVPVYWTWVGMTMHANMHDIATARARLGVFAVGLCGLLMAIELPDAWEPVSAVEGHEAASHAALGFALSYWAARLVLLAVVQGLPHRRSFLTFTVAALVSGPLLVLGSQLDGWHRLAVWGLAAVCDLAVPLVGRRRLADAPFDAGHLAERYGTFVLMALGESVVATASSAAEEPRTASHLAALALAFALVCGLWWVYFVFSTGAMRGAVAQAPAAIDIIRPVLSYAHIAFIGSIIAVAAAIGHVVASPGEHLHTGTAALLCGGAALFLATFGFTRHRIHHDLPVPRLVGAACCLATTALAPVLPAVATTAVLVLVVVVVNLVEWRIAQQGS